MPRPLEAIVLPGTPAPRKRTAESLLRGRQRRRYRAALPLLHAVCARLGTAESGAALERLWKRVRDNPHIAPDSSQGVKLWAVGDLRKLSNLGRRLQVVADLLTENTAAQVPGLLPEDYERSVARVESRLHNYQSGTPFCAWAAEAATREARNVKLLERWFAKYGPFVRNTLRKRLFETCADLGPSQDALHEIETNFWLSVSRRIDEFRKPGKALLSTRFIKVALWQLSAWRQQRLRERERWTGLREDLAGVDIGGAPVDLTYDFGRTAPAHSLGWYDRTNPEKWPGVATMLSGEC